MYFQISCYLNDDADPATLHVEVHTNHRGHTLVTDTLGAPDVERRLRGAIGPVLAAIARDIAQAIEGREGGRE
jgi:hypothetical protein